MSIVPIWSEQDDYCLASVLKLVREAEEEDGPEVIDNQFVPSCFNICKYTIS